MAVTTASVPVAIETTIQTTNELLEDLQKAVLSAQDQAFATWAQTVRSQQKLAEASLKAWFKAASTLPFPS